MRSKARRHSRRMNKYNDDNEGQYIMKSRKIAFVLCVILAAAMLLGACSLFGGDDDDGELPELKKRVYWSPGEYFVTNVKDNPKGLAKVTVSLMLSKDMASDLDTNVAAIRNIILQVMMEKTEEELTADNVIESLENEMTEKLSEFLQMEEFIKVYISDFVIQ